MRYFTITKVNLEKILPFSSLFISLNADFSLFLLLFWKCSCKSETFSTLRFAQGAKAIQNQAVVNEITQDDVNVLREQIRQLKVVFMCSS